MLLDNGQHMAYTRLLFKASAQESRRSVRPAGSPVVLVLPLPKADNTHAMFGDWARHSQSDTSISQDLLDLSVSRGPLVLLDQDTGSEKFPPSSVRAIPCTATGDSSKLVFALTTSAGTAETFVDSDTSWHTQEVRARSCT